MFGVELGEDLAMRWRITTPHADGNTDKGTAALSVDRPRLLLCTFVPDTPLSGWTIVPADGYLFEDASQSR